MIVGIGVDIVEVERIARALRGSDAMEKRVFTPREIEYCSGRRARFQHYAGRFAAKEAALKALGTGWSKGIRWRDVETLSSQGGKPRLLLHGRASEILADLGPCRTLVTITHSDNYAVAVVILEREAGGPTETNSDQPA